MIKKLVILCLVLNFSCAQPTSDEQKEAWKKEIMGAEKAFNDRAEEVGIQMAFYEFAADDAVIMRNNKLISGKTDIRDYLAGSENDSTEVSLQWTANFADVAESGELGYTYGTYEYLLTTKSGSTQKFEGIFHTVWKKQKDGTWKFVWD